MNKIKIYAQELWWFLSSGIFVRNFGGVIGFLALLIFISISWLKCYTNHGESLQVHNYEKMPLKDAVRKAETRSFKLIVNDSLYLPDEEPGIILNQNPTPFSRVKENRSIYVTITKVNPDLKPLPGLVGNYNYDQYSKQLKRRGMRSRIKNRIIDNKYENNTILELYYKDEKIEEEDIKKGVMVPMGCLIEAVVTERGGGEIPLPDLVCQRYDAALFLINSLNLNIGSEIKDKTVSEKTSAYVWRQTPSFLDDKTIRMGEQIDIYLTQFRPEDCPIDPLEDEHNNNNDDYVEPNLPQANDSNTERDTIREDGGFDDNGY